MYIHMLLHIYIYTYVPKSPVRLLGLDMYTYVHYICIPICMDYQALPIPGTSLRSSPSAQAPRVRRMPSRDPGQIQLLPGLRGGPVERGKGMDLTTPQKRHPSFQG